MKVYIIAWFSYHSSTIRMAQVTADSDVHAANLALSNLTDVDGWNFETMEEIKDIASGCDGVIEVIEI